MRFLGKALIAAGAACLMAAPAYAEVNLNLYGASAQYLLWHDAADDFLAGRGCTATDQAEDADGKHGITRGTGCPESPDGIIYFRYSSKASYDGIFSCKGEVPPTGQETCDTVGPRYREMADETLTNFSTGDVSGLSCKEISVGASDVEGNVFTQVSHGQKKGHLGGGWKDQGPYNVDVTGMTYYRPVVVPFGFFANTSAGISNLTRLQALMIFSGKAWTWDDFGGSNSKYIVVCMRHAGSGTHATLDAAVMHKDWPLATTEINGPANPNFPPVIWFNDGSSDMMRCVDQNGGLSSGSYAAVGYADSDQNADGSYANVVSVDYNGAAAVKANIVNGVYSFWSNQWLFECDPTDPQLHPLVTALNAFASIPGNMPLAKRPYWATASEMRVTKANSYAMPTF